VNTDERIINQTKKWIADVVIGCNFCPFAAREIKQNTVFYTIEHSNKTDECLYTFINECERLDEDGKIETSLIIFSNGFKKFDDYLDIVSLAEKLLKKQKYEGIYQVASFHPEYRFANSPVNDAADFTNRSPYPMLHLLREERIEQALANYSNPEKIPERNINFAREKGTEYMKMLRDACL
jgi:uncharacterized protein